MATSSSSFPDVWSWLHSLPPITQWRQETMSTIIYSSSSTSLKLSIPRNPILTLSILADFNNNAIALWSSKPIFHSKLISSTTKLVDDETISNLFVNFVDDVLKYSPNRNTNSLLRPPKIDKNSPLSSNSKDMFNFAFLTLIFLVCIYEAPADLRSACLQNLKTHLACPRSREITRTLMRVMGATLEDQWILSVNLAITNWIAEEAQWACGGTGGGGGCGIKTPSPLFSYAISAPGLWKVRIFCPVIAMDFEKTSATAKINTADDKLSFSLNHHQLEGVIQLNYRVAVKEKWIEVMVNVDNIRCDIIALVNETLMWERGAGKSEKHFPSRISLQLTPTLQTDVQSVSVGKSTENPLREVGTEKTVEGAFDPTSALGLKVSAGETVTMNLKPWKFEQSIYGDSANFNWFLHDSVDGREVFSSSPSKFALLLKPKAWFKNRYSNISRPFTRQGGVIFANDEYGESVLWKVDKGAMGKVMQWEIRGWVWLTYWPNKHRTLYSETRRLEFRETVQLTLA